MNQQEPNPTGALRSDAKNEGKKRYEKPAVRYERVFETMALSCGKIQTTNQQCKFNRKAS
jgi:hypothetical protein